jgi:hypothetical protein
MCAIAQDFSRSRISQNLITADNVGKKRFFADNLVDFCPIKANLGSLLKNVFGIFKTNMWTFKVF